MCSIVVAMFACRLDLAADTAFRGVDVVVEELNARKMAARAARLLRPMRGCQNAAAFPLLCELRSRDVVQQPATTEGFDGGRRKGRASRTEAALRASAGSGAKRCACQCLVAQAGIGLIPADLVAAVLGQYAVMSAGLSADGVSAHLLFPPSATVLCSARRG